MKKKKNVNSLIAGALILGVGIFIANNYVPSGTFRYVVLAIVCIIGIGTLIGARNKSKKQPVAKTTTSGLSVEDSTYFEAKDTTCVWCGSMIEKKDDYCISCGRRVSRCSVCKQSFSSNEEIGRCPYCDSENHLSHFHEWIKVNGSCPNCLQHLTVDRIIRDTNY